MIWKAMFDAHSKTWGTYGRACFTEADDETTARQLAQREAEAAYPEMRIELYAIGVSTQAAWDGFKDLKQRQAKWTRLAREGAAYREIFTEDRC